MINKKAFKSDLIFLLATLLGSLVCYGIFFGFDTFFDGPLDFQLYDTYYVVSTVFVIELFFFTITFVVFLVRQLVTGFRSRSGNVILITVILLLVAMTYFLHFYYLASKN